MSIVAFVTVYCALENAQFDSATMASESQKESNGTSRVQAILLMFYLRSHVFM